MFPLFVVSIAMQGQGFTLVGETERNAMRGRLLPLETVWLMERFWMSSYAWTQININ